VNSPRRPHELSYEARARIADNLFLHRMRAGYSQEALSKRALLCRGRVNQFELGRVRGLLDTYVRLAGSLSITIDDLLAGVTWTPGMIESEVEAGYLVEFEIETPDEHPDAS
jgi:transcriptional regulator with XRE-family HTH domain